jgi:hypothetical protein
MQDIFIERPYEFIPPYRGRFLPRLLRNMEMFRSHLRKHEGVESYEIRHGERLRQSVDEGCGVLLTPNHPRTADPVALGWLAKQTDLLFYGMASSHLFYRGWLQRKLMQIMGAFSVYREGTDRQAINLAVEAMATAERPVVIFGEGTATRSNDRLTELMDGLSFVARTAAKKREKTDQGKVVIHPVAFKYVFKGDLVATTDPVLTELEERLTFRPMTGASVMDRIDRLGAALLGVKEIEYFGEIQDGNYQERQRRLVDRLMRPIEEEWLGKVQTEGIILRIKNVRMRIFPDIANGKVTGEERARRYRQLEDTYLAQQVTFHDPSYLAVNPTFERVLEAVERLEEDVKDHARPHRPWHVIMDVGEAIEVTSKRDKTLEHDPVTRSIQTALQNMLSELSREGTPYQGE